MGNRTKKAFIIGILFILFASGYKPILLLTFGEETDGLVIDIIKSRSSKRGFSSSVRYPIVLFNLKNHQKIIFEGGIDVDRKIHVGQNKKILFLPVYPQLAEINSFHCLFDGFLIKVIISLLVWVAFMTSFNDLFDKKPVPPLASANPNASGADLTKPNELD